MPDMPSSASDTPATATVEAPVRKLRLVRWLIGLPVAFFAILMALGYEPEQALALAKGRSLDTSGLAM